MTRQIQTDLPTPEPVACELVDIPGDLAPNEVRLSTGKIVRVRRTNAFDGVRLAGLLRKAGINAANLDQGTMSYYRALYAIESTRDEGVDPDRATPHVFPTSAPAIQAALQSYWEDDFARILLLFGKVSGLKALADEEGEDGATF